jgi:MFS family permease
VLVPASVGAIAAAATTIPAARLADRVGRRPVILAGAIGCVVWALPMFGALLCRPEVRAVSAVARPA